MESLTRRSWLFTSTFCFISTCLVFSSAMILPPRLSTPKKEIVAQVGETGVVLECSVDMGDEPISYRWLKNNEWVTARLGYSYRAYRKVLIALHAITEAHQGVYICEAANQAGVHTEEITIIVEEDKSKRRKIKPVFDEMVSPAEILGDMAASLNDVLAEGDCSCDVMFLIHASPDAPTQMVGAQANLVHTIADNLISDSIRVSVMTYSDYVNPKLTFGVGTNRCALKNAFEDLDHSMWATRLQPVLRESFKKFKKSTSKCKILFLPIFGSGGPKGRYLLEAKRLQKQGVKIFVFDVTKEPTFNGPEMASMRGDGKPYYWFMPFDRWPSIVTFMKYMEEDLDGCMQEKKDIPGVCVNAGGKCTTSAECYGIGIGCIEGVCQTLECNVDSTKEGCCKNSGDFWCGDITRNCSSSKNYCDGYIDCMNARDEVACDPKPCTDKITMCQTSNLCLDLYDLCDGKAHCPGGEDEDPRFCKSFPCPTNRPFRCRNGQCISKEHVCDGAFMHCPNGEDEELGYCSRVHTCPSNTHFKCDYGICLKEESVCDGIYNCLDAKDESLCIQKNCPADRPFKCDDGECIEDRDVCNGIEDACNDGSDERNCTSFICPFKRSFKCNNGICIDRWLECNGQDECGDNSDESSCASKDVIEDTRNTTTAASPVNDICYEDEFLCRSGACIPANNVCDGRANCLDGDDEDQCMNLTCPSQRPFRCTDGACVDAVVCDGISHCFDASDELNCTVFVDEVDDVISEDDDVTSDMENEIDDAMNEAMPVDEEVMVKATKETKVYSELPPPSPEAEPQPENDPEPESEPESEPEGEPESEPEPETEPESEPKAEETSVVDDTEAVMKSIEDQPLEAQPAASKELNKSAANNLQLNSKIPIVIGGVYYFLMR